MLRSVSGEHDCMSRESPLPGDLLHPLHCRSGHAKSGLPVSKGGRPRLSRAVGDRIKIHWAPWPPMPQRDRGASGLLSLECALDPIRRYRGSTGQTRSRLAGENRLEMAAPVAGRGWGQRGGWRFG